jgi:hypothetical protein
MIEIVGVAARYGVRCSPGAGFDADTYASGSIRVPDVVPLCLGHDEDAIVGRVTAVRHRPAELWVRAVVWDVAAANALLGGGWHELSVLSSSSEFDERTDSDGARLRVITDTTLRHVALVTSADIRGARVTGWRPLQSAGRR